MKKLVTLLAVLILTLGMFGSASAFDTKGLPYAVGTCDGTGAAINVCLGWYPSFIEIWNLDDASDADQFPHVFWFRSMAADSNYDEGLKELGDSTTAAFTQAEVTSNGLSLYAGGTDIYYDRTSSRWETASGGAGTSVEEVYVDGYFQRSSSSSAKYLCYGAAVMGSTPQPAQNCKVTTIKGFVIGTDGDLNVDGEQLFWIAYK